MTICPLHSERLVWAGGRDLLRSLECQRHYPIFMTKEAKSGGNVTKESGKVDSQIEKTEVFLQIGTLNT